MLCLLLFLSVISYLVFAVLYALYYFILILRWYDHYLLIILLCLSGCLLFLFRFCYFFKYFVNLLVLLLLFILCLSLIFLFTLNLFITLTYLLKLFIFSWLYILFHLGNNSSIQLLNLLTKLFSIESTATRIKSIRFLMIFIIFINKCFKEIYKLASHQGWGL